MRDIVVSSLPTTKASIATLCKTFHDFADACIEMDIVVGLLFCHASSRRSFDFTSITLESKGWIISESQCQIV